MYEKLKLRLWSNKRQRMSSGERERDPRAAFCLVTNKQSHGGMEAYLYTTTLSATVQHLILQFNIFNNN